MLVMQFKIIPLTANVGVVGQFAVTSIVDRSSETEQEIPEFSGQELARPFLYLLLVQGLLAGLTIGKLAEGRIKAGIKHSFILSSAAFLISSGTTLFLG